MKDSLQAHISAQAGTAIPVRQAFSPKRIIESLPEDATPAQQDSAIQAQLPPREKVRSARPDTLNLPGWRIPSGKLTLSDLDTPADVGFFQSSPYLHAELPYRQSGLTAEAQPYLLRHDDAVSGVLLGCLLVVMTIFANSRKFIKSRVQDFFLNRMEKEKFFSVETGREMRHAVFLYLQGGLLASLIFFIYTQSVRDLFMAQVSTHALLGAYVVVCWAYLGLKQLLYLFVNWVFFDKERRTAWMKSYSFLVSSESVLLFPLALIAVFFNLPVHEVMLCSCLLVGFVRILLFYKTFCIFFPKIHGLLHLIVYFCALEMLPLCGLWQALTYTNDILL